MVRRKLLGDPEVVKLAQEVYRKHKRAVDLVCANRPDIGVQLGLDRSDKDHIRFAAT